jgi:hypothetical protein
MKGRIEIILSTKLSAGVFGCMEKTTRGEPILSGERTHNSTAGSPSSDEKTSQMRDFLR